MSEQMRLRFKPDRTMPAVLPTLDPEQRAALKALPIDLVRGIARLYQQPAPRITKPDMWPLIVSDALYLGTTGWASLALAQDWHPLELFGCAADVEGDDRRLGLAARLDGRDILRVIDDTVLVRAEVECATLRRNASVENTVYLWDYGQ